jgi:hypothetical protein
MFVGRGVLGMEGVRMFMGWDMVVTVAMCVAMMAVLIAKHKEEKEVEANADGGSDKDEAAVDVAGRGDEALYSFNHKNNDGNPVEDNGSERAEHLGAMEPKRALLVAGGGGEADGEDADREGPDVSEEMGSVGHQSDGVGEKPEHELGEHEGC